MLVDVKLVKKTRAMPLEEMRSYPQLAKMITLKRGNRLSITPVTDSGVEVHPCAPRGKSALGALHGVAARPRNSS